MITFIAFVVGFIIGAIIIAVCSAAKCADCEIDRIHHRMEGIQSDIDEATQKETELAHLLCQQQCPVCCTREEVRG